jgi:hypothetical protein
MKYIFIFIATLTLTSCNWFKKKGKETVNKTGEVVAKTGSEFADGVSKGIEKTFTNEVTLSDQLKNAGLNTGKIVIVSSDSATDNIISAYLVFNKDFEKEIIIKVFDESGQEYGRAKQLVHGKKDEAGYIDFIFGKRTNIDSKGRITFE